MTDRDVPHFLLEEDAETRRYRWRESVLMSVITHLVGIVLLLAAPMIPHDAAVMSVPAEAPKTGDVTYLAVPPNNAPPPATKPRTPFVSDRDLRASVPGEAVRSAPKLPPVPEAPKAERPLVAQAQPPQLPNAAPQIQPAQPPPILPESRQTQAGQPQTPPVRPGDLRLEQPKLPTSPPGVPGGAATSGRALEEAMRSAARERGGQVIGDEPLPPGAKPKSQASVGEARILTDTQGVDFDPYLRRVVADIRQNWYAVMPEIARLGRRGRVVVVFEIQRDGGVPKLYLVAASGAEPLDRAALAGISASVPFPPLPNEFRGPLIRVQVTFLYNMAFTVQ